MSEKIAINLGKVQETLLLPLWGRAVESRKAKPSLVDPKAVEIIENIDYDFSMMARNINPITQLAWVARSLHIDRAIQEFIRAHPRATIVNIGCGLDTTFERIGDGDIRFYDLDLPDVIQLRRHFFQDNERRTTLSGSFLEPGWMDRIERNDALLFVAAGVLYYFEEEQVKAFLVSLADRFNTCEIFFDAASPLGVRVANRKVIQDGGMDESAILKWGISSGMVIERWDSRITLLREFPMFKGFKKGYPPGVQYGLWMSDRLRIMSMVHLGVDLERRDARSKR